MREAMLAGQVLITGARHSIASMATFSGWLMAGTGATFTFFLTNMEKLDKVVAPNNLKLGLKVAVGTILLGALVKYLSNILEGAFAASQDAQALAEFAAKAEPPLDLDKLMFEVGRGALPPHRWFITRMMKKAAGGDVSAGPRFLSVLAQMVGYLTVLHAVSVVVAGYVIVAGL
jgi:hypothetical protein